VGDNAGLGRFLTEETLRMNAPFDLAVGVDLGGTKIEAVVLRVDRGLGASEPFEELSRVRVPTLRDEGYGAVVARTADTVRAATRDAGIELEGATLGVGMPGSITRKDGFVKNSNTTCLNGRPFREDLARALAHPIVFENDANCFALAETVRGAARAYGNGVVFGVIMGTGVGGGVVVKGKVWEGTQGLGGEWGHHAVWAGRPDARPCYCGQKGCLEQYASGPAVEADYAARSGSPLSMHEIAARRGDDPHARAAIETLLDTFGRAVANLIDILDPAAIVLGGGLSNLDVLLDEGRSRVAGYVFNDELLTPILRNELGDSAGVFGAALAGRAAGQR
jgi:fructokinase